MKLITQNGNLDLPRDFSLTMERTNPLLSGEGDASVPATLPASSHNLAVLSHRERIDRAERYINKIEAILQVGPVQKRGQLVIDTAHRRDGIEASFAVDSSDLYVKAKDKSLKTIFEEADKKETFQSLSAAKNRLQAIYGGNDTFDYTVFPVAVGKYEENGYTVYQYNNEIAGSALVWESRTVHEGDVIMSVPDGYGLAPFLKLHALLRTLFECLDYTVVNNCFTAANLSNLTIVHNCSDCLVTEVLKYADMVPSCTLSDFLEWLLAKFHAQPVVDSESKTVNIVLMEDMLASEPDMDLTALVEGDWKVQLNPDKRIVLTPSNELDDTPPAEETFDKLIAKYGGYVEVDEVEFSSLFGDLPVVADCLVLRKATGVFFSLERNPANGLLNPKPVGTNHFTYDRDNASDSEAFSQADVMPLMLCGIVKPHQTMDTVPYIGDRIHYHTSYENKEEKSEQKIICVQRSASDRYYYTTTGTTQKYVPYKEPVSGSNGYTLAFDLTNYGLYDRFWKRYNEIILNNATRLTGKVKLQLGQILALDMSCTKLSNGQQLLPVKASARLADKVGMTEMEALIVKTYTDGVSDTSIVPMPGSGLKWEMTDDREEVGQAVFDAHQSEIEAELSTEVVEASTTYTGCYAVFGNSINPGLPNYPGETRIIQILADMVVEYHVTYEDHMGGTPPPDIDRSSTYSATVTFEFTAVSE